MKKIIPFILALQIVCSLIPAVQAGKSLNPWVLEAFESSQISHIRPVNAKLAWDGVQTLGGSKGSLFVSVTKDAGAPSFAMTQEAGTTYEISCYIKVKEAVLKDQVQFIFQAPAEDQPEKNAYNTVTVSNAGLQPGRWTHITGKYVCDGLGKLVGTASRVPVLTDGTVDIRLGDGKISGTSSNGSTVDYWLDDFTIMPAMAAADGNLVTDGDFEAGTALTSWTKSGTTKAALASGGADGTARYADITGQSNLSNLSQQIPVKFNTDYRISFWLKTNDSATLGAKVQVILDRSKSKTDSNIANYQYLSDPENPTINANWTKYQIDYRYNINTNDTAYPTLYLRIGDGKATQVQYCLDQVSVMEAGAEMPETALQLRVDGVCRTGESLAASIACDVTEELRGYLVCVYRESTLGSAMVYTEQIEGNTFTYPVTDADQGAYLVFTAAAVTTEAQIAAKGTVRSERISANREVITAFDNTVWTQADNAVRGTVTIANNEKEIRVAGAIGVYGQDGRLESVDLQTKLIGPDARNTISLEASASQTADSAKLFAWDAEEQRPLVEVKSAGRILDSVCIYVDPQNGSDTNSGAAEAPLATIARAKDIAKVQAADGDTYVMLKGGTYRLEQTIAFTSADLDKQHQIIFASYNGKAVLSGGRQITDWKLHDGEKGIYRAYVGPGMNTRQLYVNGIRAVRARSAAGLTQAKQTTEGYTCTDAFLAELTHPEDLEMVYYVKWTNPRCRVAGITENSGEVQIAMDATGWSKIRNKGQSSVTSTYLPAYYENAYELIDQEGEWYMDTHSGYLYYKPRFFEDMNSADVEMPVLEKLLTIRGTADSNAANLEFRGIDFMYTTWMDPTENGYLADMQNNHQSGIPGALPDAAVELSYVNNIIFTDCIFAKLGITAMKLTEGVKNCRIAGNAFYDISGTAVSLGVPSGDYSKYINPTDERYVVRNNQITDNYIHHTGMDYKSAAAISAAFPKDTQISYNEIYASPYSGLHLGYGWNTYAQNGTATENLTVKGNYIHNVMNDKIYDGGAIYTMGKTSGTAENYNRITQNYIKDVRNHYGALYPDEGSQFWEFSENVIDLSRYPLYYGAGGGSGSPAKWLHLWTDSITNNRLVNNYATTANATNAGKNNVFEEPAVYEPAAWPEAAQDIIEAAGIRQPYAQRLTGGMQDVEALTEYVVQVGDEIVLSVAGATGKGRRYDFRNAKIYIQNSAPEVVRIGSDFQGQAISSGEATIRIAIVEDGILQEFTMEISVI